MDRICSASGRMHGCVNETMSSLIRRNVSEFVLQYDKPRYYARRRKGRFALRVSVERSCQRKCRTYPAGESTVHSCDKESSQGLKDTL